MTDMDSSDCDAVRCVGRIGVDDMRSVEAVELGALLFPSQLPSRSLQQAVWDTTGFTEVEARHW